MPKDVYELINAKAGVKASVTLEVPKLSSDPASPANGEIWLNTTDHAFRWRENGVTYTAGTSTLDSEAVQDAVGGMLLDTATVDLAYNDSTGQITATVLDSPTLEGSNKAYYRNTDNHVDGTTNHVFTAADDTKLTGIATGATANSSDATLLARANHTGTQLASTISDFAAAVAALSIDADTLEGQSVAALTTAITAAIVDGAPGTLDTLNELAAAINDDAAFSATLAALVATKARTVDLPITGGATTEVITHNFNTRRGITATVYVDSGNYEEEEYQIYRSGVNTITIVSEAGNIPAGRRVHITAVGT